MLQRFSVATSLVTAQVIERPLGCTGKADREEDAAAAAIFKALVGRNPSKDEIHYITYEPNLCLPALNKKPKRRSKTR